MKLLYLTACRAYAGRLREVNNTYRAAIAGQHPGVTLGGPGFDAPIGEPLDLPEYVRRYAPGTDAVFVSDPWHNFWDPCPTYPDCPLLYTGIDECPVPVVIESGDSQFYYGETINYVSGRRRDRAVAIRALSHRWRFDSMMASDATRQLGELGPPGGLDCRVFYLPHGAYPEMVEAARGVSKDIDVLISGSVYPESYPARARVAEALREHGHGIVVKQIPHPGEGGTVIGPAFWRAIARSRFALAGTNIYRNLTMRYLEIPACGALAIGDVPHPESEHEPWAQHMMPVGDLPPRRIAEVIRLTLADPEALARKTAKAREWVLTQHSFRAEWARVVGEIEAWVAA